MRFPCPHCHTMLTVKDAAAGRALTCPSCQESLTVPQDVPTPADPRLPVLDEAPTKPRPRPQPVPVRPRPVGRPRRGGNGLMTVVAVVLFGGVAAFGGTMLYFGESPARTIDHLGALAQGRPWPPPSVESRPAVQQDAPAPGGAAVSAPVPQETPKPAAPPTAEAAVQHPEVPALDDESRAALLWLQEHVDNLPRAVALTRAVALGGRPGMQPVGSLLPLGKVIDPESIIVLIDGSGYRIPTGVTDLAARAKTAKAAFDAETASAASIQLPSAPAEEEPAAAQTPAKAVVQPSPKEDTSAPALPPSQAFTGTITAKSFRTNTYPRVFLTREMIPGFVQRIKSVEWAQKIYQDKFKAITPFVDRHKTEPQWIVSRLCMNWGEGKHYTTFKLVKESSEGNNLFSDWSGNAPYPTVIPEIGRVGGGHPDINWVHPYNELRTTPQSREGKIVEVPFTQLGRLPNQINAQIIDRAYDAAIIYLATGDRAYAKFAADVFWTFCRGLSFQEQLNPEEKGGMHGLLGFETLGDGRYLCSLPHIYDLIHDYLWNEYLLSPEYLNGRPGERWAPGHLKEGGKAGAKGARQWGISRIHIAFQKLMDNKIERGGGVLANWNVCEHNIGLRCALAMDDNKDVFNGRGREFYTNAFLLGPSSPTHGSFFDSIHANFSPLTGLWPEAPGSYGQLGTNLTIQLGYWYFLAGIDVLDREPILRKAGMSFPQVAFPHGLTSCWGDGGYYPVEKDTAEYMIAYARAKGNREQERAFTTLINFAGGRNLESADALFLYVPALSPVSENISLARMSYSETHSLIIERNMAEKTEDCLAYSVYAHGDKSGHRHKNGLAMELYGRGHVLGIDPGAGDNYWSALHHGYNMVVTAHNTVIPNGHALGWGGISMKIENGEPAIVAGPEPKPSLSPLHQFTDTSIDYEGKAAQRRVMGIVRTSSSGGFYVDIFRSRSTDKDVQHDYLYHNIGRKLDLYDAAGATPPFKKGGLDPKSGPGYDFFQCEQSGAWEKDLCGIFQTGVENDIAMKAWLLGQAERTVYSVTAPPDFRYEHALKKTFGEVRVPTLLVRQQGEAWQRPFIAIYEPFDSKAPSTVGKVRRMTGAPLAGDLVAVAVEHMGALQGRTDYVFNATSLNTGAALEELKFQGIYGVATKVGTTVKSLYLGAGMYLGGKKLSLQVPGVKVAAHAAAPLSAELCWQGLGGSRADAIDTGWHYAADGDAEVTIPVVVPAHLAGGPLTLCLVAGPELIPAYATAVAVDAEVPTDDGRCGLLVTAHLPAHPGASLCLVSGERVARR